MECKNCETTFESNFCPNCGQKAKTHQITIGHVVHDIIHAFTHADKGFLLLAKMLLTKPGEVAVEYIRGKRTKYYNPLSFLVITTAISAYLFYKAGYFEVITTDGNTRITNPFVRDMMYIVVHHGKFVNLILISHLIAISSWMFFRKAKLNLAEHFVITSFFMGEVYILRILLILPAFILFPTNASLIDWLFHVVMLVYMVITYQQVFHQNMFFTIVKSILIMIFYITFFWLFIFLYVYLKNLIIH